MNAVFFGGMTTLWALLAAAKAGEGDRVTAAACAGTACLFAALAVLDATS